MIWQIIMVLVALAVILGIGAFVCSILSNDKNDIDGMGL